MEADYQVSLPGSLLEYVLFNMLINDLKIMLNNEVIKFPYETKFFRVLKAKPDCVVLQKNLMMLSDWTVKKHMKLIVGKDKVRYTAPLPWQLVIYTEYWNLR